MTKARTNASASPAVGRNIIQNGAMNVAQRSASVTGLGASAGYFTCDRWKLNFAGSTAGRLTMSQTSDGPNGISANCIKLDCTTADTSIAAGEFAILQQLIEGQNLQRLGKGVAGAKQITVSFYVKGSRASTQVCNLYEGDNNRHIGATFSVTTDWTRVEITFPADEDDGSSPLADDNTVSIYFQIWLHAGSTYAGGTIQTTWANYVVNKTAAGCDSLFSSTDNNFFLTGVQMEVGPVATEFEQEDISTTLQKCQRYYHKYGSTLDGSTYQMLANGHLPTTSRIFSTFAFSPPMRTQPTMSTTGTPANYAVMNANANTAVTSGPSIDGQTSEQTVFLFADTGATMTAGQGALLRGNGTSAAFLGFDAEL